MDNQRGKIMNNAGGVIKAQQKCWAGQKGIEFNKKGYCTRLEDNLFQALNCETHNDYKKGDGNELKGNMRALHSSSALVCNFFDYWRTRDMTVLADALDIKQHITRLKFEEKFPTELCGTPPNLDLAMFLADNTLVAIESKFTEPYHRNSNKNVLTDAYFRDGKKLWVEKELSHCQKLAEGLRYKYLDAAQLLKHILGLASDGRQWELLYLWFNPGGTECEDHKAEIERFINIVNSDGQRIRAITYQSLFNRMSKNLDNSHAEYKNYLAQRYFNNPAG